VDKQKLEEARLLAMSMTSHPVAFGTIEHTERAGELLGLLWQEVLRLECDLGKEVARRLKAERDAHRLAFAWHAADAEIRRLQREAERLQGLLDAVHQIAGELARPSGI